MYTDIDWGLLWPFAIIGFGTLFFIAMFAAGKSGAAFADSQAPLLRGLGWLCCFQNITGHWTTMRSYVWTLILIFVSLGIYIMGRYGEDANQWQAGARVMKIGIILFIGTGWHGRIRSSWGATQWNSNTNAGTAWKNPKGDSHMSSR